MVDLAMAVGVKQEQVGKLVCSLIDSLEKVMDMPSALFCNLLVTNWAFPCLSSPEGDQLSPFEPPVLPL